MELRIGARGHDFGVTGLESLISAMKTADISALQLVCYKTLDGVAYVPGGLNEEEADETGRALNQNGISVPLVGAYFNPVHPDTAKIELGMAVFKDYIRLARSLGADVVGSETGSYNGDKWTYHPQNRTAEARERVIAVFRELCDFAAQYGVNVGIEGAAGHVCHNIAVMKQVIREIGRPNLRVIFDLYNLMDADNASDYIEILEEGLDAFPAIHCFHIKDCAIEGGVLKQMPVGKGSLDFKAVLSRIKRCDGNATLILEGTTGENLAPAARLLRDIWETI